MTIRWCDAHGAPAWKPSWTRVIRGSEDYCLWVLLQRHGAQFDEPCQIREAELR